MGRIEVASAGISADEVEPVTPVCFANIEGLWGTSRSDQRRIKVIGERRKGSI